MSATLESTIYREDDGEETEPSDAGRIELIFGPMFSGKSTELHRQIRRHKIAGRSVLLIKYKDDRDMRHPRIERECDARPPIVTRAVRKNVNGEHG